jgi:hypothetical protein
VGFTLLSRKAWQWCDPQTSSQVHARHTPDETRAAAAVLAQPQTHSQDALVVWFVTVTTSRLPQLVVLLFIIIIMGGGGGGGGGARASSFS